MILGWALSAEWREVTTALPQPARARSSPTIGARMGDRGHVWNQGMKPHA
jgi:hypothetical protein